MTNLRFFGLLALLHGLPSCSQPSELYCTASQPCTAGHPVCDVEGVCTGITNTCVPEACWDASPGTADAGVDAAAECMTAGECDDSLFCNGEEQCSQGRCQPGTPPVVDDGVSCTADVCDETANIVTNTAADAACDNADKCDGIETCSATSDCQNGQPVQCPADTTCIAYACVPGTGSCVAGDRVNTINYHVGATNGTVALMCDASATIHTETTASCDWTCICDLNAQGELTVHCTAVSLGTSLCSFRPGDPVTSGCSSSDKFGGIECCFP